MAIRKFRSVEEMDGYHWYEPGDPVLFRAIRRVWELGYRTVRPRFPAGVHKHREVRASAVVEPLRSPPGSSPSLYRRTGQAPLASTGRLQFARSDAVGRVSARATRRA